MTKNERPQWLFAIFSSWQDVWSHKPKAQDMEVLHDWLEESLPHSIKEKAWANQVDLLGVKIEQVVDYLNTIEENFPAATQSNEDSTSK